MNKFKMWWHLHRPTKRRIVQVYAAVLLNANIKGYVTGTLFKDVSKYACGPGINCYSCPGATTACPLGSLQSALSSENHSALFYVMGILMVYGIMFGRWICGWLCPFGLIQEWFYKIPTFKIKKGKWSRVLSYLKYVLLFLFVFLITFLFSAAGQAVPAFCKYICPAGTLEAGYPLLLNSRNESLHASLTSLYSYKTMLVVLFITASIFLFRPFCRFICPLGAWYGFFGPFALFGIVVNESKCTHCGLCVSKCKLDIHHVGDHECIHCGECIPVCPTQAISWKGGKFILANNEIPVAESIHATSPVPEAPSRSLTADTAIVTETTSEVKKKPAKQKKEKQKKTPVQIRRKMHNIGAPIAGVAAFFGIVALTLPTGASDQIEVGVSCPTATLKYADESKGTWNLSDDYGKVVLVDFWGTWCAGCKEEMPGIGDVAKQYSKDQFHVVAVSDSGSPSVDSFVKKRWSEYLDVIDFVEDDAKDSYFFALGGSDSWPRNILVNQKGKIANIWSGVTENELKTAVDQLLA